MRPVVYLDFDGVINVMPWLSGPFPVPSTGFDVDRVDHVRADGRWVTLRWSTVLADRLYSLRSLADMAWLSTWQPWTDVLYKTLGWGAATVPTARWYDPVSRRNMWTGKLDHVCSRLRVDDAPLVWVDDEECDDLSLDRIRGLALTRPVLMVKPDARIGVSRRQMALIDVFVEHPWKFNGITLDVETPTEYARGHHAGL